MAFNRKQRLRDNIEAIRTAFILDREQRTPTARERLLLERYCGFGGLKCILNPARELTDAVHWAKSDLELFAPTVELHRLLRENTKDETEYKRYMDAMKQSVLTAFYTPPEITGTIADVLHEHGIRPDRVLEPSAGVGAFVDAVLENRPDADIMAFEKDLMTGKILKHLHPGQKVRVQGFEKIEKPFMNHFDLAVSNIPFGDVAVFDPDFSGSKDPARYSAARTIHNYFFLKSLDAVREGGIVAFITSQGVLDAPTNAPIREYMMNHANLVGVARLPNNLFTENAGTEVGSDLIILQKNSGKNGELYYNEKLFVQTEQTPIGTSVNGYVWSIGSLSHTDLTKSTDPYGKPAYKLMHRGDTVQQAEDLREHLKIELHQLNRELYERHSLHPTQTESTDKSMNVEVQPSPKVEAVTSTANVFITEAEKPKVQPIDEKPEIEPRQTNHSNAVQLTLLDLWGMPIEEPAKKKKATKKENKAKSVPSKPKPQVMAAPPVESVKPATESKEAKQENAGKQGDPEDIYATLDWETNPDIDILGGAMLCIGNTREQIIYYNTNKITVGDLLNGTALGHPSVMMRVKSITSLRYERQYIYAEDFRLWCQALKAGLKMTSLREVVIKYRFTGHNVSCAHALKQREAALSAKADLEEWVTASEAQYATKCATSMSPHKKMLTIIVTFLNEGVELERTIEGIRHTVGDTVDIIVINDCSYDGYSYGERLSSFDVRYVVNRHRLGVAASRDLGVKLCKTPYFLLLDAHMRFYDNSWADRIVEELRINERQILCCQGRVLYKDEHSGEIVNSNNTIMYGAYSPFQKDGIWPDITWNYKEKDSSKSVEDIPFVLGAAYAASKKYWQHLYGLKGLHNYGADEQYISLKAWLEGGRCTLLKDVIIGHIYRKKAPYLILGRDTVYNLMYIAKLLFPPNMYSKTVATSLSLYRDFANEALETFEKNKIEIDQFKKCLNGIFERTFDSILPMHQWCREYDIKEIKKLEAMLPNIAQNIQEKRPLDNGLMEGKAGVLIWLCHYGKWNTDACINDIITELFSTIETYVEEQRLPWNFRYGLSGIGWGVLYLYFKGLINVRPDYLIDQIDKQLCVIHPESIEDYGLDAGAAGILAYLTLRLTIDYSKFQKFPLDQWYAKAKKILRADTRQEVIYYAHLFISIYEEKPQKLEPLIGVWLNAPKYLPEKISNSQYTLADGVLGTTLQIMLILQNSKQ